MVFTDVRIVTVDGDLVPDGMTFQVHGGGLLTPWGAIGLNAARLQAVKDDRHPNLMFFGFYLVGGFVYPYAQDSIVHDPTYAAQSYDYEIEEEMDLSSILETVKERVPFPLQLTILVVILAGVAFAIRRRRQCLACKGRYTTYERIEGTTVKIIKKDGVREPFDRSKIKQGLEKACWKRPISDAQLEGIIAAVENELETSFESEVESRHVGELVMQHLRELDQVAYVRFASVYREFKDVHDFVSALRPILDESRRLR